MILAKKRRKEKHISIKGENDIIIELSKKENFGISIFVEDKKTASSRTILSNYQAYDGSRINIPDLDKTWNKHYIFTINQFEFTESDPVGPGYNLIRATFCILYRRKSVLTIHTTAPGVMLNVTRISFSKNARR